MRSGGLLVVFALSIVLLTLVAAGEHSTTFVTPPWNHCLGLHRVGQLHLDLFSGYTEKFNDPEGLFCTKLHCKDDPDSDRDDDELTVFGLNSGRHRIIYNKSLTSIGIVGGHGTGLTEFDRPRSITGDRDGNVYVADTGNDRIVHLRYVEDDLVPVKEIRVSGDCRLAGPTGVSFSGGLLYIADGGNDRIVACDTSGAVVKRFTTRLGSAVLHRPLSIAAVTEGDDWFYYRDFFFAVVDSTGQRLWKISPDGTALGVVRYENVAAGGAFNHVAIDYFGNIYATDTRSGRVLKFDRHLNFLVSIGGGDGVEFDEPRGVTIYRQFGQVFISERAGAQYFWIGTDLFRVSADKLTIDPVRKTCSVHVSFLLSEHSLISMHFEDEDENVVFTLLSEYVLPGGRFDRTITVPYNDAKLHAKCKVRLAVVAKPMYSSRGFLTVTRKSQRLEITGVNTTSSTHP